MVAASLVPSLSARADGTTAGATATGESTGIAAASSVGAATVTDGERIVFSRDLDPTASDLNIWMLDPVSGGQLQLTSGPGYDHSPVLSPDGSQVAFVRDDQSDLSGQADIYIVNTDGSGLTLVVTGAPRADGPSWSPDGTQLVYGTHGDTSGQLQIVDIGTGTITPLTPDTAGTYDFAPDWSPDGASIAFARDVDGQRDIWVVDLGGPGTDDDTYRQLTNDVGLDRSPSWSPDGTTLVYAHNVAADGVGYDFDLYTVPADGSGAAALLYDSTADDWFPAYSPDGADVVFAGNSDGNESLYVLDSTGTTRRLIDDAFGVEFMPDWGVSSAPVGPAPVTCPGGVTWDGGGGDGQWSTASNWSNDAVPTDTTDVCITGDATVTVSGPAVAGTLTLGPDTRGVAPTLHIAPGWYEQALTVTGVVTNAATIDLSTSVGSFQATLASTTGILDNRGTITVPTQDGYNPALDVPTLINEGTIEVTGESLRLSGAGSQILNQGSIEVSGGGQVVIPADAGATFTNEVGAYLSPAMDVQRGNSFVYAGGALNGQVTLSEADLSFADGATVPDGSAPTFVMHGNGTLAGDVPAGATVHIQPTSYDQAVTAATGFTNGGTIELSTGYGTYNPSLVVTSGTLTNDGTITVPTASSHDVWLEADGIENIGTVDVGAGEKLQLTRAGSQLVNTGTVTIADADGAHGDGQLRLPYGKNVTFTNADGATLDPHVYVDTGNTFVYGGGSLDGAVTLVNAALSFANGASVPDGSAPMFVMEGNGTLAGDVPAGATVHIHPTSYEQAVTAATGFTNGGTIELSTGYGTYNPSLVVTSGTLTNDGTITVPTSVGYEVWLDADEIDNAGTIDIGAGQRVLLLRAGSQLVNTGTVTIADADATHGDGQLKLPSRKGVTLIHQATGSLTPHVYVDEGNTFVYAGGALDGAVTLMNATLSFADGASVPDGSAPTFVMEGNDGLTGDVPAGATVRIRPTYYDQAVTAATAFTNHGTIEFAYGYVPTLRTTAGTFTNEGTVEAPESQAPYVVLDVPTFDNVGTLRIMEPLSVTGTVAGLAGGTLSGGSYDLGAELRVPGADVSTIAADLVLRPGGAIIDDSTRANALSGSPTIASGGALTLLDGRDLTLDALTNGGGVSVGADSLLTVTGTYTQQGAGSIDLAGPTAGFVANAITLADGTLGGTGTITGDVNVTGGTLAPGHSPGALTIDGNLTLDPTSTLRMEIEGPTAGTEYDQLVVTGDATLDGTVQTVTPDTYSPVVGQPFQLVTVAGSVTDNGVEVTGAPAAGAVYVPTVDLAGLTLTVAAITVPDAPGNVQAVAGDGQVTVSWSAPASDGGSPITGYRVAVSPGGQVVLAASDATDAVVSGLDNGTAYTFTVVAVNGEGDSPASEAVTATPAGAPTVPTGVEAVPGNGQVTVSWIAPVSDGGSPITGYRVAVSPGGQVVEAGSSATEVVVSGLDNGTAYTFTVVAVNGEGDSPASVAVTATPVAPIQQGGGTPAPSVPTPTPSPTDGPVTGTVDAGGSLGLGDVTKELTSEAPVAARVTTPTAGSVSVEWSNTPTDDGGLYSLLGAEVHVEAPRASAEDPLDLTFRLDSSLLDGVDPQTVAPRRNGLVVPRCRTEDGTATPDPCFVVSQSPDEAHPDADLVLEVRTSSASLWSFVAGASDGQLCPGEPSDLFADVPSSSPHAGPIGCLSQLGIVNGTTDSTFGPARALTRAQLASLLVRMLSALDVALPAGSGRFTDVAGSPHASAIESLAAAGILRGVTDDTFAPDVAVTRGQMASLLVDTFAYATGSDLPSPDQDPFPDDDRSVHEDAINRGFKAGLVSGTSDGHFGPRSSVRRDQAASFLMRLLDLVART